MPSRIIKEQAVISVSLSKLSAEAERLFWRLVVTADDFGRFIAHPAVVKARCFPLKVDEIKTQNVGKWLQEIVNQNCIVIYVVGEGIYGEFKNWEEYNGKRRNKYSKYPAPTITREVVLQSAVVDEILEQTEPKQIQYDSNCPQLQTIARNCASETRDERRETRHDCAEQAAPEETLEVKDLVDSWNENFRNILPQVEWPLSESRHRKAKLRLGEHKHIDYWQRLFQNVASSSFLLGKTGTWRCTFDFLIANDTNCQKIYEGQYSNGKQAFNISQRRQ